MPITCKQPVSLQMDVHQIEQQLRAMSVPSEVRVHWFGSLGSTSDYILYETKRYHACVCIAGEQTAGRGRRGRSWHSAPGQGIYLSMGWDLGDTSPQGLSLVCGLSVLDALQDLGVCGIRLKWPNDVLLHGRKLAGILVELNRRKCVIGLGLNVTLPTPSDSSPDAMSLWTGLQEHGYQPDLEILTAILIRNLYHDLVRFCQVGFSPVIDRWNASHAYHGVRVVLVGSERITGSVAGVNEEGALCLHTDQGIRAFHAGEVSLQQPGTHRPEP